MKVRAEQPAVERVSQPKLVAASHGTEGVFALTWAIHLDDVSPALGQWSIENKVRVTLHAEGAIAQFKATCSLLAEPLFHSDINELRLLVEAALARKQAALDSVVWEEWLEVELTSRQTMHESHKLEAIGLSYRRLDRGCIDGDARALGRSFNGVIAAFPLPKPAGQEDVDAWAEGGFQLGRPKNSAFSYMKATPENVDELEKIQRRISLWQTVTTELLDMMAHGELPVIA